MKLRRDCPVVVLGAGPSGMVAALEVSKHYRTALLTRRLPSDDEAPRVEAVPASLIAQLVEFGIHPAQIGVERLHESRLIAWEQEACAERMGPVAAHVERPALDLALLRALTASQRVDIIWSQQSASFDAIIAAARHQDIRLIDATGRRSASAKRRIHPARPWAARTFLVLRRACSADTALRIAALPRGFVYRLGAARYIVVGIVGRGKIVAGAPLELEQHLHEYGAGWILEGLPPIVGMTPGRTAPSSVQWTSGDVGRRIGDAALARDILSSQGLASGISEALYVAAIRDYNGENLLSLRQVEQRVSHLRSLASLIARCRFRESHVWREYAEFIAKHLVHKQPVSGIALRAGQIHRICRKFSFAGQLRYDLPLSAFSAPASTQRDPSAKTLTADHGPARRLSPAPGDVDAADLVGPDSRIGTCQQILAKYGLTAHR
jgi:flavin-dependent dehydrogenase